MMRRVSARIHEGSALDALASGAIASHFGLTKRLHDVVQRYVILLREARHRVLTPGQIGALAASLKRINEPWPTYSPTLLAVFMASAAPDPGAASAIANMKHSELIALVEDCEELIAGGVR